MASESQLQQRTLCILNVQERSFPDYYSGSPRTPWGKVHHQTEYDGANFGEVSTEHHGGMFVRGEWAKKSLTTYARLGMKKIVKSKL